MKILVSGATGLIGRKLCFQLLQKGHDLLVVTQSLKNIKSRFPYPAEFVVWESNSQVFPVEALHGVEAVIHLAGEPIMGRRWTAEKKKKIYSSRVDRTQLLAQAVKNSSVKTFISTSAIGYYGDRQDEELTENSNNGSGFLAEVCSAWESSVENQLKDSSVRTAILRVGVVMDREAAIIQQTLPLARLGLLGPIGCGKQWMSWIHINDVVNLFLFALENPKVTGVLNATAPQPVTNKEWTKSYMKQFVPWVGPAAPIFAIKLALGDMSQVAISSQKVFPKKALGWGFQFEFSDIETVMQRELSRPWDDRFVTEQWVPKNIDEVFDFFSDEKNLEKITPPFLNFKVLNKSTENIQEGTLINYKLKIHGVPAKWTSEIRDWNPPNKFVDTQIKGPYHTWYHEHEFQPLKKGVLLRDQVHFRLPFGSLGRFTAGSWVVKDVKNIFSYRKKIIAELFGE